MNQISFRAPLLALLLGAAPLAAQSQTTGGVGIGTSTPNAAAALDITSTSKGLLLPRLTLAQRNALTNSTTAPPVAGLVIYQSDNTPGLYAYDGAAWVRLGGFDNLGNHTATQPLNLAGQLLVGGTAAAPGTAGLAVDGAGKVGIGTSTPLAALHLSEGTALFTAAGDVPASPAPLGVSGTGRRAFWYADKAAFRAGYAGGSYTHVILTAYPGAPNSGAEATYVAGDGSTYFDEANVGPYSFASGYASLASGQGSVAMGTYNRATGLNAVTLGERTLASGDNSVAIGSEISVIGQGGVAIGRSVYSSAAFATAIGLQCFALAPYSMALGKNAWTRHQGAVTISDASASFSSDWVVSNGPNELNMRFVGGYYFNTSVNTRGSSCGSCGPITGVMLAPGGGSWTTLSDRRAKENFRPVDAELVLGKLAALPVTEWNYKSQPTTQRHIGPMAQDFYQAFRLDGLGRDTTINTADIDGVNLVAIQALAARTARLQVENEQLRAQLGQQQTQLPALETHTTTAEAQATAAVARAAAAAAELRAVQAQAAQATATLDTFEARLRRLEAATGGAPDQAAQARK